MNTQYWKETETDFLQRSVLCASPIIRFVVRYAHLNNFYVNIFT